MNKSYWQRKHIRMFLRIFSRLSSSIIWRLRPMLLFCLKRNPQNKGDGEKTILLFRIDGIGDYILFRNFLDILVNSSKFQGYKFKFLGSTEIESVLAKYDLHFFDEAYFIDKRRFYKDLLYHIRILIKLRKLKQETVVNPLLSHEDVYNDYIIQFLNGSRITFKPDSTCNSKFQSINLFSNLLKPDSEVKFEFLRNMEFCNKLLGYESDLPSLSFNEKYTEKNQIAIFPGAQDSFRCWAKESFLLLINRILSTSSYKVLILGGNVEKKIGDYIMYNISDIERVKNLTGKTDILELINIIGESKVLIANETVAIHIAAATKTRAICISNGNHYGRFNPYSYKKNNILTIYPAKLDSMNEQKRIDMYRYRSDLDINLIDLEMVFSGYKNVVNS